MILTGGNKAMKKKSKLQKKKDNPDSPYWNKKALKTWSMVIRMKANNHCEMCNRDNCKLDAHHIQSKVFKNTRFKIENGICLCPKCHKFGNVSAHKSLVFYEWLRTNKPTQYQWILDNYNREDNRTYKEAYEYLIGEQNE